MSHGSSFPFEQCQDEHPTNSTNVNLFHCIPDYGALPNNGRDSAMWGFRELWGQEQSRGLGKLSGIQVWGWRHPSRGRRGKERNADSDPCWGREKWWAASRAAKPHKWDWDGGFLVARKDGNQRGDGARLEAFKFWWGHCARRRYEGGDWREAWRSCKLLGSCNGESSRAEQQICNVSTRSPTRIRASLQSRPSEGGCKNRTRRSWDRHAVASRGPSDPSRRCRKTSTGQGQWKCDLHGSEWSLGCSFTETWTQPLADHLPKSKAQIVYRIHWCWPSAVGQTPRWPECFREVHSRTRCHFGAVKKLWGLRGSCHEAFRRWSRSSWKGSQSAKAARRDRPEAARWDDTSRPLVAEVCDDLHLSLYSCYVHCHDCLHSGLLRSRDRAPRLWPRNGAAGALRLRLLRNYWIRCRCSRSSCVGLGAGHASRAETLPAARGLWLARVVVETFDGRQLLLLLSVGFPRLRGGHDYRLWPHQRWLSSGCPVARGGIADGLLRRLWLEGCGFHWRGCDELETSSWKSSVCLQCFSHSSTGRLNSGRHTDHFILASQISSWSRPRGGLTRPSSVCTSARLCSKATSSRNGRPCAHGLGNMPRPGMIWWLAADKTTSVQLWCSYRKGRSTIICMIQFLRRRSCRTWKATVGALRSMANRSHGAADGGRNGSPT